MREPIPVRIKICGMRTGADIDAVNAVRPDFAGFIFDPTRRRYIDPEKARELMDHLDPFTEPVGVFVNAKEEDIDSVIEKARLRTVQLHGQESNAYMDALRKRHPYIKIIKAYEIRTKENLEEAEKSHADLVLLDHGKGGTGEAFDWSLLQDAARPFILAGGLTPDNVAEAIRAIHPAGIDASSSLETDGHKDPEKIRRFVEAARAAGNTKE